MLYKSGTERKKMMHELGEQVAQTIYHENYVNDEFWIVIINLRQLPN